MKFKVKIDHQNPHVTNEMMHKIAQIIFPQMNKKIPVPLPYTVNSTSTHYIIELADLPDITEEIEKQLMLLKLQN